MLESIFFCERKECLKALCLPLHGYTERVILFPLIRPPCTGSCIMGERQKCGYPGLVSVEASTEVEMAVNLKRTSEVAVSQEQSCWEGAGGSPPQDRHREWAPTSTEGSDRTSLSFVPCAQGREAHPSAHHLSLQHSRAAALRRALGRVGGHFCSVSELRV